MIARLDVLLVPAEATPERMRGASVVVIDVLRATTVVATALANGAAGVIPVATAEDAAEIARRLGRDRCLLGGERHAVRIAGFDLDNAPGSYGADVVRGKTVVLTTTNGTQAIARAGGAVRLRTAALVDRGAVARALLDDVPEDVVIVCAGNDGGASFEDIVGAGALVDAILARHPLLAIGDGARVCAVTFHAVAGRLADAVASGDHAQRLAALGFAPDLVACARIDALDVTAELREGILVAA